VVKVVGDGQVVHAHLLDGAVLFRLFSFELLHLKNIVRCCGRLLHLFHLSIHVGNFIIHVNYFVLIGLLCSCRINIIDNLHGIVHVNNTGIFTRIRDPGLEPIVFQGYLLYGTSRRLHFSYSFLTGHSLSNQELLFFREVIIEFFGIAPTPSIKKIQ
jgi:hypothetical protein